MKTILILYSCIIFFSLQIHSAKAAYPRNRLYIYLQYIQTIQNEIQNKIDGLTRYNVLFLLNTQFLWAIIHRFTFNDIELKISGVTNDTRKYIDSTIGNTVSIEHCYITQHLEFEDIKIKALLVYYTCEAASIIQLSAPASEITEIAQKGEMAIEELEKIIPSCLVSRSALAQEGCIFGTIRKTKPFVQAFMDKYKVASQIRREKHRQISTNFENCHDIQIRTLEKKIIEIGRAALNCVQGL
uniref:Venom protein n=1 Tax=Ampulex compressa TaxID=860918 RepID=A0A1W6EW22_AMPCP|nr:venom protein [Ampulex compressa]